MTNFQLVLQWHRDFGAAIGKYPQTITNDLSNIRIALIEEELNEYKEAVAAGDLIAIADALGDLLFVVYGSAVTHGIDADKLVAEITWSNNTKLGSDGKPVIREDGKVLKGPDFQPPRLAMVLGIHDEPSR